MASLNTQSGSSSKAQRQVLVIEAKRRGIALDELRSMVGGSVSSLSAQAASNWIRQISGRPLPHAPGKAPRPYARKASRDREGAIIARIIAADHIEQIERLGLQRFDDPDALRAWLRKNFKVDDPRQLGTAARAGEVIRVLKQMLVRKEALSS